MGLIKDTVSNVGNAAKNAANSATSGLFGGFSGVLNQALFQEYFTSGDMSGDVLMKRAEQVQTNGSVNNKSDANVISNGSIIDVQNNQCMIIVENGKVVEACMEPGRYTYKTDLAPSFFAGEGKFGERIVAAAKEMWEQAKVGGQRHNTQRVYFINTGVLDKAVQWGVGNVQFRHTQRFATNAAPYIIGVRVKGNGLAKVRIERPLEFYENYGAKFAGGDNYTQITIDSLEEFFAACKSNMIQAVTGAITALGSKQEMMYEDITLPENLEKIAESVNAQMDQTDIARLGFDFYQFSVNQLILRDEDMQKIQDAQQKAYDVGNINLMNYNIQMGQVSAMQKAAENSQITDLGGAGMVMGGMMMGGGQFGNIQAQPVQQYSQQPQSAQTTAGWTCACGTIVDGNFCPNCGTKKPVTWQCNCGHINSGNFCGNCGAKRM
ncbi:MAG: SPFH domain-containing protein [Agathobacter sp.]|nr:SPFH domain-containing protein [Lachnospiraceae bacterium]MBR3812124.1 SPFH domain-containing protein [Agathobacter sp.]